MPQTVDFVEKNERVAQVDCIPEAHADGVVVMGGSGEDHETYVSTQRLLWKLDTRYESALPYGSLSSRPLAGFYHSLFSLFYAHSWIVPTLGTQSYIAWKPIFT
jgi:hypothetical protein